MTSTEPQQRITALDIFRGVTIAFMVLVNTPGTGDAVYAPLEHAEWNGWTPTDVVFPSFVWIVGVAMTLALGRKLAHGVSKADLFKQAAKRAAILFVLGLIGYSFPIPDPATFRILGVLQRIAICYLAATGIYLTTSLRGQIAWIVGLLGGYWLLMAFAPVPGVGSGYLDVERNFAHYIDRIVLGSHNYVNTKTWDPEGIVSTLPAIATCLMGILAGHLLAQKWTLGRRIQWLLAAGVVLIALAYAGNPWLPINKKLWTSTFVLLMAGIDCLLFAVFLWVCDVKGQSKWFKPFLILGMNSIVVYMASELLDTIFNKIPMGATTMRVWLYQTFFAPLASPHNASLLYAIAYVLLMFVIAWALWRKRIFMRA
jgi:predicted acyltransferase